MIELITFGGVLKALMWKGKRGREERKESRWQKEDAEDRWTIKEQMKVN
jgi:hypothetical protein